MSKGLEALERYGYHCNHYENGKEDYKTIETELKRLEELEKELEMEHTLRIRLENIVYEKSEVLRIIKEKYVDIHHLLLHCNTVEYYNKTIKGTKRKLTQAEFDLLKEMLK